MAAGGQNWGKFQEKMKELRQGKKGKKDSGKSAKDLETIVVQCLSAEVSGKAQKYSRVGAREFVLLNSSMRFLLTTSRKPA